LSSSSYSAVHSFVRKPSEIKDEKLKEHLLDYELLLKEPEGEEAKKLNLNADSVFITREFIPFNLEREAEKLLSD